MSLQLTRTTGSADLTEAGSAYEDYQDGHGNTYRYWPRNPPVSKHSTMEIGTTKPDGEFTFEASTNSNADFYVSSAVQISEMEGLRTRVRLALISVQNDQEEVAKIQRANGQAAMMEIHLGVLVAKVIHVTSDVATEPAELEAPAAEGSVTTHRH